MLNGFNSVDGMTQLFGVLPDLRKASPVSYLLFGKLSGRCITPHNRAVVDGHACYRNVNSALHTAKMYTEIWTLGGSKWA